MAQETKSVRSGGVGFLGLLTVLFIGLKLTGYIAWSWWWVLAPTWVPLAVGAGLMLAGGVLYAVVALIDFRNRRKHGRR